VASLRRFRALAAVTAVSGYLQIVLGALVRVSGSGLGCPDWPTCYGRLYPPANLHSIVEYSHRSNGALFGLLLVATVAAGFWLYRGGPVAWLSAGALAAVVGEGLLGWQVVASLLAPVLVLIHLAVALLILALLVGIVILAVPRATPGSSGRGVYRAGLAAGAATYVMLLTGASVVATRADEVCKAWPLCGGGFAFDLSSPAVFDVIHRLAVLAVSLLIAYLALRARTPLAWLILAALAVQVAVGAVTAVGSDAAFFQGVHVALASAIFAGVVAVTVLARPREAAPAPVRRVLEAVR
jgi:heme A synthase